MADSPTTRWCAKASAYVNAFRNIPLLLQLLAWYFLLTDLLPATDAALRLAPGSSSANPAWPCPGGWMAPLKSPNRGAGIDGGARLTPEYLAILLGLTFYSAALHRRNPARRRRGAAPPVSACRPSRWA